MKHGFGALMLTLYTAFSLLATAARLEAQSNAKEEDRLYNSAEVITEAMGMKSRIPQKLLDKAACVIVIPSVIKGAVGFGGSYGRGAMSCRGGEDFKGPWTYPTMMALEGFSAGFQVGGQATDFVLLVMDERGARAILSGKFKIGGDAAASAGPVGRDSQANLDIYMRTTILSYSRSRGLFAGVSLEGSTLRPDNGANKKLYGKQLSARGIVLENAVPKPAPASAEKLVATLNKYVKIPTEVSASAAAVSPSPPAPAHPASSPAPTTAAQSSKVKGNIISRAGNHMTIKTSDGTNVVVVLNDNTDVQQLEGLFKARKKEMAMAALIPGLDCEVQGTYNAQNQLVADWVRFSGEALEQAQSAQAAVHETAIQAAANQADLERQNAALKEQQAAIDKQQQEIAANKAKIAANSARFGQLDDYYILDEVTVYFADGKVNVDPKYTSPLMELVQKAKTYNGYNIQVKGYASAVGSAALNQELSEERAENVTNILIQQANVPLTTMLAPGAMGESRQIGDDKTEQGQAENRRVVVRALLNKGIAGTELPLPETKK